MSTDLRDPRALARKAADVADKCREWQERRRDGDLYLAAQAISQQLRQVIDFRDALECWIEVLVQGLELYTYGNVDPIQHEAKLKVARNELQTIDGLLANAKSDKNGLRLRDVHMHIRVTRLAAIHGELRQRLARARSRSPVADGLPVLPIEGIALVLWRVDDSPEPIHRALYPSEAVVEALRASEVKRILSDRGPTGGPAHASELVLALLEGKKSGETIKKALATYRASTQKYERLGADLFTFEFPGELEHC